MRYEELKDEIKAAMKAKDKVRLSRAFCMSRHIVISF